MEYLILAGLSTFLACLVEMVEALTIILAIGLAREWRSTWLGAICSVLCLAILVAVFRTGLGHIPTRWLWLVVGGLLLVFGLQWLRNAILRASGLKALHDETAVYQRLQHEASITATQAKRKIDWYAFLIVFKGVFLEGLEVVFIILAFRAGGSIWIGTVAALVALVLVAIIGFLLQKPLAQVPENLMKFGVGLLLTSFGTLFSVEGAGAHWPGGEAAVLAILLFYLIVSILLSRMVRLPSFRQPLTASPNSH